MIPDLALIRTEVSQLEKITVCTRPFRAAGPRVEAETLGPKLLVHNYGHGGSGWSLSWGSAEQAIELAFASRGTSPAGRAVAVIGCGALGLTLATLLQRAGARVTLYARDLPTQTRSFNATGSWTPDSRIALTNSLATADITIWQHMARRSWQTYIALLSHPRRPVAFTERFYLADLPPQQAYDAYLAANPIGFARLNDTMPELLPANLDLGPGTHPFPTRYCRFNSQLMFDITALVGMLTDDLLAHGAKLEARTFDTPAELLALPEGIVFNCTGFGARKLFGDAGLTPVRGQIAWLPAHQECSYGIQHENLNVLARPDGIVVQLSRQAEATGWQDATELPDPEEAELGVAQAAAIMSSIERTT